MADIVSKEKRREMMAGIQGKDTKPELLIRKAIHRKGFRYKLHDKSLPGKPDLVFPKYKAVIQIHGCFWHLHDCHLFKWPSTRPEFWQNKISGNKKRDLDNMERLQKLGWRILVIWECALRGKYRKSIDDVVDQIISWLGFNSSFHEIDSSEDKPVD